MADDATPQEPQEVDATSTPAEEQDEVLGEAGLRALQREREARKRLEDQIKTLEPLAKRAQELEEAQKTEQQRLEDRVAAAESERDRVRQDLTRLRMAARYGIAEDDLDLLGIGTDEEIEDRAKRLSERLSTIPVAASTPVRPTEAMRLKSGATGEEPKPADGNEWLRRFATSRQ